MANVTIGFTPRERFSVAAEALERIYEHTHIPFDLIVVDCNIPKKYRQQMDKVLNGRKNFRVIQRDHYLLPNQSRNLVIEEAKNEFLCLIENDVLVKDGWLTQLMAACEETQADVAVPLILEGRPGSKLVHFDNRLGSVRRVEGKGGPQLEIIPRVKPKEFGIGSQRRNIEFLEQHIALFRRNVFGRIGLYDELLNTRDEIDLSLNLHHAKIPIIFEPKCEVFYEPPFPPNPDELDYFYFKWDIQKALKSSELIPKKWNLTTFPGSMEFVKFRNLIGSMRKVKDDLNSVIPHESPFILVDEESWRGKDIIRGFKTIPFLERDGQYWGKPPDDETAIRELERLRQSGAGYIVFAWHAFWWLDHFTQFHKHLQGSFPCLLKNERVSVFDLQNKTL